MAWPNFPIPGSRFVSAFRGDFNDIIAAMVSNFMSATAPNPTYAGMWWGDISTGLLKQRDSTNTRWVVRQWMDLEYGGVLPISGGMMAGPIDMDGYAITGLPEGSGNAPARYSDLYAFSRRDGTEPFTGWPSLPAGTPTSDLKAASKGYVDLTARAGGTFTGQIVMGTAPTLSTHVIRRTDLEAMRDGHTHAGTAGMGGKIPAVNISSQDITEHWVIEADGAHGARWAANQNLGYVWRDSEVQVLFRGIGSAWGIWETIDLSAHLPTNAVGAILSVVAGSAATPFGVRFRKYGTTGVGGLYMTSGGLQVTVPIADRSVQIYSTTGYNSPATIYLNGYIKSEA